MSVLRLAITGTDTGVGKTVVTAALAARGRQRGLRVSAMKPVESGVEERFALTTAQHSDLERLHAATGGMDLPEDMRPYVLGEPLAPLVAAQRAGVVIDLAVLDAAMARLSAERDLLLVEGAGGLLVPLTEDSTFLDLFLRWECALVIVAANRLGVINHVLLTVRAAASAGMPVRAIVLSELTRAEPTLAQATNHDALRMLLPRHLILRFPWVERPDDLGALAAAADAGGLDTLLDVDAPFLAAHAPSLPDRHFRS